jgi:RNA polymerase sigma factor (sigma-70 family)
MARLLKSADDLYEKHKKLIYNLVHQYARDGYADFQDLESLSNEVFAKCFRKWNPNKGAFSTLLYTALSNAFRSELKKGETRARNEGQFAHTIVEETTEDLDGKEWLMGFLQIIDNDARQVIAKLFRHETEPRKNPLTKKETRDKVRGMLLKKPDWRRRYGTRRPS